LLSTIDRKAGWNIEEVTLDEANDGLTATAVLGFYALSALSIDSHPTM
jgi:hypothetical protein